MPLIPHSSYKPPPLFTNGHIQSIYPVYFRKVKGVTYTRERFETPDNDFMDLDWSRIGRDRLAILLHGLEGHSSRKYMKGMVKACNKNGFDAVAMNFRGCSGEPNRLLKSYHHGSSDDLHLVVEHIIAKNNYKKIVLIGFSLGANVLLKYLGEKIFPVPPIIQKAVAISAPCDLASCAWKLAKRSNAMYMKYFLNMLHTKIKAKMAFLPDKIDDEEYKKIKTFKQFDDKYTAPIHGFNNAEDYWEKCSSKQFLPNILIPTLIIIAQNDPFLTEKCSPRKEAENNRNLFFENPNSGGHLGFITFSSTREYWHETRAVSFING
jgi:predicted alpha/beta-fold hydrolase